MIDTSPPPSRSVSYPWPGSHARRATSCVLPSCGEASVVPASWSEKGRRRAPRARPRPMSRQPRCDRLALRLGEGIDRRIRADVARVDRAGEDRLDGLGTGVEGVRLETTSAPSASASPILDPDDRRRMGHVRKVAEPEGQRIAFRSFADAAGGQREDADHGNGGATHGHSDSYGLLSNRSQQYTHIALVKPARHGIGALRQPERLCYPRKQMR